MSQDAEERALCRCQKTWVAQRGKFQLNAALNKRISFLLPISLIKANAKLLITLNTFTLMTANCNWKDQMILQSSSWVQHSNVWVTFAGKWIASTFWMSLYCWLRCEYFFQSGQMSVWRCLRSAEYRMDWKTNELFFVGRRRSLFVSAQQTEAVISGCLEWGEVHHTGFNCSLYRAKRWTVENQQNKRSWQRA